VFGQRRHKGGKYKDINLSIPCVLCILRVGGRAIAIYLKIHVNECEKQLSSSRYTALYVASLLRAYPAIVPSFPWNVALIVARYSHLRRFETLYIDGLTAGVPHLLFDDQCSIRLGRKPPFVLSGQSFVHVSPSLYHVCNCIFSGPSCRLPCNSRRPWFREPATPERISEIAAVVGAPGHGSHSSH
jgi:hypothetical protein